MTDITANVVVSMPSQLFTMARSFKAVANGKIYIGKIDTDPVNPENQIQVYVENEDGSHVPVSQPIIINAAGYPVYNGQIAKFVTVQGHSMAVYDAYGAQQFYFPNVLKYDPDRLAQKLESEFGTKYIGAPSGGGTLYDMLWFVTPAQFGAPEDGSDASSSLQEMLDYATLNGKAVLFDKAITYNIEKPLIYKQKGFRNSRILCYGGRTVINLNSSTATSGLPNDESGIVMDVNAAIVVSSTNPDTAVVNQPQAVYIEGLQFTSTAGGSYGIYLGKTQNTNINDCKFTGFTEADICDNGSWVFRVHGCQIFSAANYGIWKKAGTSAWITECYFQNSNYAVRMKSGYSVISKCANDFTKNAAYWLESSDYNSVYTIDECGFENSGSDAVVKVSGRIALTWSNCMAGNIESQQSPVPTNLLWVQGDSNGSQFTLSNIRFLNTGRRIWDLGTNSRFTINRVNHASGDLADVWGDGALVNENTYNTTKYMSSAYPNGFQIGPTGLSDWFSSGGNTGSLPNDQRFLRYSKTITRASGQSFGTTTITLPFQLSVDGEGYQVIVTPREYPNNVPTYQWHCASYNHTSTDVQIIAGRGDGNTAWSTVIVDILIIGKAINF
ncbi:phage tailspike protein [Escherichia coli]|uniref:phage tailspike protein n=1 Tax=Escherichia coli TaxID=562 RepID=UPI001FCF268A|nr:phage tailspike protein [Escherichia coli]